MFDYSQAVNILLLVGMYSLALTMFFCLFFAVTGPRLTDKIIGVNMIVVKSIILIILVGVYLGEGYLIDIALVYALISFLATIVFTRLILQFMLHKSKAKQQEERSEERNADLTD
ncbi:MAG: monovalent cation/H+ antiporter complex subunit F [Defluviitaleaceae bacterium]|nr:monovalent cation/H+ antiporter complex subunit F [Defluviitaleaceae bacterium]